MALSIIERPYKINWSRNPIRYGLQTSLPATTDGLTIEVLLGYTAFGDNNFRPIVTLNVLPDSNQIAYIDVANILDSQLDYFIPTPGGADPENANIQSGYFYIKYREITSESPDPDWIDDGEQNRLVVIKGGLSYQKWRGPNFFTTYLENNKAFLTWQKSGFLCAPDENLFLHFLQMADSAGQMKATFNVHYVGESEADKVVKISDLTVHPKYSIWCIPTGMNQQGLDDLDPDKKIAWWEVKITDDTGLLAGPYRYDPDYRTFYNVIHFNYTNSLGGIDSLRIRGEWEKEQERTFDDIESNTDGYYHNMNNLPAQTSQANIIEQISYKGNAGFLPDKDVLDAYRELLLSQKVFMLSVDRWEFVRILTKKASFFSTKTGLRNLPVEWALAYSNRNYTPDRIDVGELPACAVPTNLHLISNDGTTAVVGWTASPGNSSYIIELEGGIKGRNGIPGLWKDWFVFAGTSENQIGIDITGWASLKIRVKAICAANSSPYTNSLTLL